MGARGAAAADWGGAFSLAPAAHGNNEQLSFLIGGGFFVVFGLFVLIFTILIALRGRQAMEEGEARKQHEYILSKLAQG